MHCSSLRRSLCRRQDVPTSSDETDKKFIVGKNGLALISNRNMNRHGWETRETTLTSINKWQSAFSKMNLPLLLFIILPSCYTVQIVPYGSFSEAIDFYKLDVLTSRFFCTGFQTRRQKLKSRNWRDILSLEWVHTKIAHKKYGKIGQITFYYAESPG